MTNTIDAKILAKMFLAGAKNLESKKEWINDLNVFPVPDGDTGTNMTLTIMSAAKEVSAMGEPDMMSLCKAISSGSLRGARGNSGVILSQLFRGFTKSVREKDSLTGTCKVDLLSLSIFPLLAATNIFLAPLASLPPIIISIPKEENKKASDSTNKSFMLSFALLVLHIIS